MTFSVTCSTPSSSALAEHLPALYDIGDRADGGLVECYFLGKGWSDVYLVRARDPASDQPTRYFLKVYAPGWRTASDILFEMDLIDHLDRKNLPGLGVATPLAGREGGLLHPLDLPEGTGYL